MQNEQIKATIGIITCRRPIGLKRLLDSLINQQVSENTHLDILVVDNACEQITADIVAELKPKSDFDIHYCEEAKPGIVSARNKCVEQFLLSDSDHLFFIDDDEWPETNDWAQKMLNAKTQYNADIMTSHVISLGEPGTEVWATQLLYGENKLKEGEIISAFYTNNLLISKKVLKTISPAFDSRFAMTGASDYHFALKCTRAGFRAFYTEAPVIEEFPKSRATLKWFARRGFRSGIGFTRSHMFEDKATEAAPFCVLMAGTRFVRGIAYLGIGIFTLNKLKFVDGLFRLSSFVGSLAGFFGIKYQEYNTIHGK